MNYSHSGGIGIFLTMPRLLARFLFFLIENNTSVHDELLRLGYRSFAELNEAEGVEDASGLTTICGYNRCDIRYTSWGDVSQEHRDLTEQLSREFHSRAAAVFVEEELSEDDARGDSTPEGYLGIASPVISPRLLERKCSAKGLGEERKGWEKSIMADEPLGKEQQGKIQCSGTPHGENPPEKLQNESKILDFLSPGSKQAV